MSSPAAKYPIELDSEGKLVFTADPCEIVLQTLALVRDLVDGEFPGVPALCNPCDHVDATDDLILVELSSQVHTFFSSLRGLDLEVTYEHADGPSLLGWIQVNDTAQEWQLAIPVGYRESNVVLHLDRAERNSTDG